MPSLQENHKIGRNTSTPFGGIDEEEIISRSDQFGSAELDNAGVSYFSIDHNVLETAMYLNLCDICRSAELDATLETVLAILETMGVEDATEEAVVAAPSFYGGPVLLGDRGRFHQLSVQLAVRLRRALLREEVLPLGGAGGEGHGMAQLLRGLGAIMGAQSPLRRLDGGPDQTAPGQPRQRQRADASSRRCGATPMPTTRAARRAAAGAAAREANEQASLLCRLPLEVQASILYQLTLAV